MANEYGPGRYQDGAGAVVDAMPVAWVDIEMLRDFATVDGRRADAQQCCGDPLTLTPIGQAPLTLGRADCLVRHADGHFSVIPAESLATYTKIDG
jgi:hypothetical protein